jgi:hypothetical protein
MGKRKRRRKKNDSEEQEQDVLTGFFQDVNIINKWRDLVPRGIYDPSKDMSDFRKKLNDFLKNTDSNSYDITMFDFMSFSEDPEIKNLPYTYGNQCDAIYITEFRKTRYLIEKDK